jgi:hypothetical protein
MTSQLRFESKSYSRAGNCLMNGKNAALIGKPASQLIILIEDGNDGKNCAALPAAPTCGWVSRNILAPQAVAPAGFLP